MSGLIGKKVGMTSLYDAEGNSLGCTVLEAGPNVVTHVKTIEKDGYKAIQLGYGERGEKNATSAAIGHFKKAGTTPKSKTPGSLGGSSYPARVFKGLRMAGRMGGDQITTENLRVVKIDKEKNLMVVLGSVPGHKGSVFILWK